MTLRRSVRECVRSITPVQDLGVRTEAGTAKRALVTSLKTDTTSASGNDLQTLQHLSSDAPWAASGDSFKFMATTYKTSHSKSEGDCVLPVSNHKPEQCLDLAYILEGRTDDVYYGSRKEIFQVLAAYNDRLKALETERSTYNERILCLETSKTSLQNETWLLKEEFKRMNTILEARSTNLPLQSGSYIITNAGFKNELGFPVDPAHPDRSVLSAYSSRSDTQKPIVSPITADILPTEKYLFSGMLAAGTLLSIPFEVPAVGSTPMLGNFLVSETKSLVYRRSANSTSRPRKTMGNTCALSKTSFLLNSVTELAP